MLLILLHHSQALNIDGNAKAEHTGITHLQTILLRLHGANLDNADAVACLFLYHPDIDLEIRNDNGKTALDIAKSIGNNVLVDLITQRQQEMNLKIEGPSDAKLPKLDLELD